MQQHFLRRGWKHLVAALWIAGILWLKLDSQAAQAITPAQADPERATTVSGKLSPSEYHYLGLEPALRDGTVVLTLAVEPADDTTLRGAIDFVVLTEDGLRRVLAGADPLELDIAASQPLQFDPIGNKYQAMFKASGRGNYTVVVYNDGGKFGSYLLTALNGVLVDDAGQVDVVTPAAPPLQTPIVTETSTPTETLQAEVSLAKASPLGLFGSTGGPAPAVDALRISGMLDKLLNRHFLAIKPGDTGGEVNLTMTYEPQGDQTREQVSFWLLDNDDVRQLLYGLRPEDVAFATGLPQPFNAAQNVKVAGFTAPDINEYTVIPYSTAPISVSYVMEIDGGLLVDRYGQTNESKAALAEYLALSKPVTNTAQAVTDTNSATAAGSTANSAFQFTITGDNGDTLVTQVNSTPAATLAVAQTGALTQPLQVSTVEGSLPTIFSHNYWTLEPTLRDGNVIITLDYDPRDQKELNGRINFWVIDEDGLRRILAGSRPDDLALAAGSEVLFGPDKGKLQGAFRASGRGAYAVIVYNDSVVPATYQLRADGGNLILPPPDSKLVEVLP